MTPAGLKMFETHDRSKCAAYCFENVPRKLASADEKHFRTKKETWNFFPATATGLSTYRYMVGR